MARALARGPTPPLLFLLLLPLLACERGSVRGGGRAGVRVLKRQVEDLTRLVERAEKGSLLPKDKLVVAVSEKLVKDVVQLALPREQVVLRDYRVRLERADVSFRDGHGAVRFDGRVSTVTPPLASALGAGAALTARPGSDADRAEAESIPAPPAFAELAVFGLVDTVEVDPRSGTLRGRIALTGFELQRLEALGQGEPARHLLEELGRQGVDVLEPLAFPVTLPVKLEQEIAFKGAADSGPIRLRAARFPVTVTVAEVTAHASRLWVTLDVGLGAWSRNPSSSRPPTSAAAPAEPR